MSTVLVTGGSGFIGSHCILQLLAAGHQVRTTVRSLKREGDVRAMLREGGAEPGDRLSFVVADLARDAGWAEAVAGCEYVLHVASPLPPGVPKHEDELIIPAREGTLRLLRGSREAGVKRVVLTSSFAAIGYGRKAQQAPFTENDWTDLSGEVVAPYQKSKTLAERAAWDFMTKEGGQLELSVINPVGVLGPVLVNYIRQFQIDHGVPKAQAYSITMYIMCALLLVGFLCNFAMRPVNEKYHYRGREPASTPAK